MVDEFGENMQLCFCTYLLFIGSLCNQMIREWSAKETSTSCHENCIIADTLYQQRVARKWNRIKIVDLRIEKYIKTTWFRGWASTRQHYVRNSAIQLLSFLITLFICSRLKQLYVTWAKCFIHRLCCWIHWLFSVDDRTTNLIKTFLMLDNYAHSLWSGNGFLCRSLLAHLSTCRFLVFYSCGLNDNYCLLEKVYNVFDPIHLF